MLFLKNFPPYARSPPEHIQEEPKAKLALELHLRMIVVPLFIRYFQFLKFGRGMGSSETTVTKHSAETPT